MTEHKHKVGARVVFVRIPGGMCTESCPVGTVGFIKTIEPEDEFAQVYSVDVPGLSYSVLAEEEDLELFSETLPPPRSMNYQVGDVVKVGSQCIYGGVVAPIVKVRDAPARFGLKIPGHLGPIFFAGTELIPAPDVDSYPDSWLDVGAVRRLNAENEAYRKEAQEARALQRKFYDETVDLRKQLAQVTAERDAANQQCACAVQKLDDLRACLKALAR